MIRMASSVWIAPTATCSSRHTSWRRSTCCRMVRPSSAWAAAGIRRSSRRWAVTSSTAVSVTEEQIEIFKHAWSAPYVDFDGRFYEIDDVSLEPKLVQRPHPRPCFGAVSEIGARRAARTCDGIYPMFLDSYGDPARFEHLRDAVLREAERIGRDVWAFRMYASARVSSSSRAMRLLVLASHDAHRLGRPGAK